MCFLSLQEAQLPARNDHPCHEAFGVSSWHKAEQPLCARGAGSVLCVPHTRSARAGSCFCELGARVCVCPEGARGKLTVRFRPRDCTFSRPNCHKKTSVGPIIVATFQGRKINFTKSKTLVGWSMSRPTVTRVTSDLPECEEL